MGPCGDAGQNSRSLESDKYTRSRSLKSRAGHTPSKGRDPIIICLREGYYNNSGNYWTTEDATIGARTYVHVWWRCCSQGPHRSGEGREKLGVEENTEL